MFWADKLLENISGRQVINDSWTPSGMVHMGSLKGPVIHDVLFQILKEKGVDGRFMYGFDDFDPIDGLPQDLIASHKKYLGFPISVAPSPDGNGTFGDYFGNEMKKLLDTLGIEAEFYKTSILYREGKFDEAIKFVLDHAQKIRDVYSAIYKRKTDKDWYPLQVVCPSCGKLGTTKVIRWDGEKVRFECSKTLVKWAKGCGMRGEVSPLGGNAKMPYKVEWAAKWMTFDVAIEGAGKDHMSAGGTYDVAMRLAKDVFKIRPPLGFAYEFFLVGGKKMSASKGIGSTSEELLEILTPQAVRFLMIKTRPEQAAEFDPRSPNIIPRVYDDYQKGAKADREDDLRRAFDLSQIGEAEKVPNIRFATLAQWVQMPNMEQEIRRVAAEQWAKYARIWVEKYAPESEKFEVRKKVPEEVRTLSNLQKNYLKKIADVISEDLKSEDLQTKIYEMSREMGLTSKDAFAAIYISLLGKDHGPKAAWLITSLDQDFVRKRFSSI